MRKPLAILLLAVFGIAGARASEPDSELPGVTAVTNDSSVFMPDPFYGDRPYDPQAQVDIYGGKHANPTARPLLELGRELYTEGPFKPGPNVFGEKNLLFEHLLVYGDWRTAVAYNDNGVADKETGTVATRLNLDVDLKLTATERIHAFFRPLDDNGVFTHWDFGGDRHDAQIKLDGRPLALFFEGDVGAIASGVTGKYTSWDLPVAAGLMPLLFQNGVWVEDAFTGVAFTIPAKNSRLFDISNMDVTLFSGFDKVSSAAIRNAAGTLDDHDANVYGFNAFIETHEGYAELGYGYIDGKGDLESLSYHNLTAAYTRRYFGHLANSVRVIWNTGQNPDPGLKQTADGVLLLCENSIVTDLPLTLVPYLNLFAGFDKPQSLARDPGAGGVLKNTGILFETDGLTGSPTLDATAQNTYGGALGVEYLFNLEQQIVLEAAVVKVRDDATTVARGDQFGLGARYQRPLSNAWILRADVMYGCREKDRDIAGVRLEIRRKF